MRHTFASKVVSLFRELPDYIEDVETEGYLFKSAVITSTTANCVCKLWEVKWVYNEKKLLHLRKTMASRPTYSGILTKNRYDNDGGIPICSKIFKCRSELTNACAPTTYSH